MLLIGGWDGGTGLSNSIYSSQDGKAWAFLGTGNFSARYGHTSLNFLLGGDTGTDRAWIFAGKTSTGLVNDIWSATDGKAWSRVDTGGTFPVRFLHSSVVFDPDAKGKRMWVIGGIDAKPEGLADVWSSTTGTTWNEETPNGFPARGGASAVTFKDPGSGSPAIFLIAGVEPSGGTLYNDVWDSTDGATWKQITPALDPAFKPRFNAMAFVVQNGAPEIWITGGTDGTKVYNDTWFTKDGLNWNQVTDFATNPPRFSSVPYYFNGALWLEGGFEKAPSGFYNPLNPDDEAQSYIYP